MTKSWEYQDYCNTNYTEEDIPKPDCLKCGDTGKVVVTVDHCDYETVVCPECKVDNDV